MNRTFTAFLLCCALLAPMTAHALGMKVRGAKTELRLVRHDIDVDIVHPVAVVRVVQEFENATTRMLEADYSYRLPTGAHVDDLALWVNGVRRPARMLERQKAKEIYEGIVAQKRDPALVEKTASGVYRVRIFPILPKTRTRIELRYTMLAEARGALHGVRVHDGGRSPMRLSLRVARALDARPPALRGYDAKPSRHEGRWVLERPAAVRVVSSPVDILYEVDEDKKQVVSQRVGLDRYVVKTIPKSRGSVLARRTAILLDTSKSMNKVWEGARALVEQLAAELPSREKTLVFPLTLEREPLSVDELRSVEPSGGNALVPAYEAATRRGMENIVLITDGLRPSFQAEIEHLARRAYDAGRSSGAASHFSVIELGGAPSEAQSAKTASTSLRFLADVSGGVYRRIDHEWVKEDTMKNVVTQLFSQICAEGARERGQLVLRRDAEQCVVVQRFTDESIRSDADHGPATLWAAAKIHDLQRKLRLFHSEDELRPEIVRLSKTFRVASEYTALLVTEKDTDYDRPTSGRVWQRKVGKMGDNVPAPISYHGTPEPHEWLMIALGLVLLYATRRRALRGILFRRH